MERIICMARIPFIVPLLRYFIVQLGTRNGHTFQWRDVHLFPKDMVYNFLQAICHTISTPTDILSSVLTAVPGVVGWCKAAG